MTFDWDLDSFGGLFDESAGQPDRGDLIGDPIPLEAEPETGRDGFDDLNATGLGLTDGLGEEVG